MELQSLLYLCLSVLKDFRVIVTALLTILFISIGNYVVKYRKKPIRVTTSKIIPQPKIEKQEKSDTADTATK